MAVLDESSVQEIEVVLDESKLQEALRRPFQLSHQSPVRWVVLIKVSLAGGVVQQSHTVFAAGHHIGVDGTSMSVLSSELLEALEAGEENKRADHRPRLEYGEYIHRQASFPPQGACHSVLTWRPGGISAQSGRLDGQPVLAFPAAAHATGSMDGGEAQSEPHPQLPAAQHMEVLPPRRDQGMGQSIPNLVVSCGDLHCRPCRCGRGQTAGAP